MDGAKSRLTRTGVYIGHRRGTQLHRRGARLHIALLGRHLLGRTSLHIALAGWQMRMRAWHDDKARPKKATATFFAPPPKLSTFVNFCKPPF